MTLLYTPCIYVWEAGAVLALKGEHNTKIIKKEEIPNIIIQGLKGITKDIAGVPGR